MKLPETKTEPGSWNSENPGREAIVQFKSISTSLGGHL